MQCFDQLFDGEARRARPGDELSNQLPELTLPLALRKLDLPVRDECAGTLLRIERAANLHLSIGAQHSVGIDDEIDGYLAHGWKLISGCQHPCGNRGLYLVDELPIDRNAAVGVQTKGEGSCVDFSVPSHENNNVLVY